MISTMNQRIGDMHASFVVKALLSTTGGPMLKPKRTLASYDAVQRRCPTASTPTVSATSVAISPGEDEMGSRELSLPAASRSRAARVSRTMRDGESGVEVGLRSEKKLSQAADYCNLKRSTEPMP